MTELSGMGKPCMTVLMIRSLFFLYSTLNSGSVLILFSRAWQTDQYMFAQGTQSEQMNCNNAQIVAASKRAHRRQSGLKRKTRIHHSFNGKFHFLQEMFSFVVATANLRCRLREQLTELRNPATKEISALSIRQVASECRVVVGKRFTAISISIERTVCRASRHGRRA